MYGAINVSLAHNPAANAKRYCWAALFLLGSTAFRLQLGCILKKKKKAQFSCAVIHWRWNSPLFSSTDQDLCIVKFSPYFFMVFATLTLLVHLASSCLKAGTSETPGFDLRGCISARPLVFEGNGVFCCYLHCWKHLEERDALSSCCADRGYACLAWLPFISKCPELQSLLDMKLTSSLNPKCLSWI